jgi:hypothetical protein
MDAVAPQHTPWHTVLFLTLESEHGHVQKGMENPSKMALNFTRPAARGLTLWCVDLTEARARGFLHQKGLESGQAA